MHAIVKKILESNSLPAVKRCLEINRQSQEIIRVFGSLESKVQEAKNDRVALMEKIIREPHKLDFAEAVGTIATANAADELGMKLSARQHNALEQIQKDPQAVDDLEAALREIIEHLDAFYNDAQKSEKKHAQNLGVEYGGQSPTLSSLAAIRQEYVDALTTIENLRDSGSGTNWFQGYIQLFI